MEAVQDEHDFLELYGVDGTIRAAGIVFDYLKNARAAESFEDLRGIMPTTPLCEIQSMAEKLTHIDWKRQQVPLSASNPYERFFSVAHDAIIPEQVYPASASLSQMNCQKRPSLLPFQPNCE